MAAPKLGILRTLAEKQPVCYQFKREACMGVLFPLRAAFLLVSVALTASLAGCASPPKFTRADASAADLGRDSYECERDAKLAVPGQIVSGGATAIAVALIQRKHRVDFYSRCMQARGYQPVAEMSEPSTSLSTTEPPLQSQGDQSPTAEDAQLDSDVADVNAALGRWNDRFSIFLSDSDALLSELTLLRNHPGWRDMATLIRAIPSVRYLEGDAEAQRKLALGIAEWSQTWRASGARMHTTYLVLRDRSRALESERLAVRQWWDEVSRRQDNLFRLRILRSVNRARSSAQIQALSSLSETLSTAFKKQDSRTKSFLDIYGIDPLGLYERRGDSP